MTGRSRCGMRPLRASPFSPTQGIFWQSPQWHGRPTANVSPRRVMMTLCRCGRQYDLPIPSYIGSVESVAWSPDSKLIASGAYDRTVKVWDATTEGKPLFTYTGHILAVSSVAWSPDGKRIASASYDDTVQVWQAV